VPTYRAKCGPISLWKAIPLVSVLILTGCDDTNILTLMELDDSIPSEAKLPPINPRPSQIVTLIVSGLDVVKIQFASEYSSVQSRCGHQIGSEYVPYNIKIPVKMISGSGAYHGSIAGDEFLPVDCGWHLDGIIYETLSETGPSGVIGIRQEGSISDGPTVGHKDLWCQKTQGEIVEYGCLPLAIYKSHGPWRKLTEQFLSQFSEQQKHHAEMPVTVDLQEIRVDLHDLEAIPGALERSEVKR
jgi:hypothetical protein